MASLKGVNIKRGILGANTAGNDDAICGLLLYGVAIAANSSKGIAGLALNTTVKLRNVAEAEALGITADYDTSKKVSVYRHISEFFRIAGEGNTLYVRLHNGSIDTVFEEQARQMIADADGEIRILGVSGQIGSEPTYKNGLPTEVYNAIAKAQDFYDFTFETFRPCQVILEGYGFNAANATEAADLRNLEVSAGVVLEAFKVSVCIGQDYQSADGLNDKQKVRADIGTMLGSLAYREVNGNIGEVQGGNIANAAKGTWIKAGLSDHKPISEWDSYLETLDEKGYIFAIHYAGMSGFYWNNDYTCTPVIRDKDGYFNEYTISYGRVLDKAVRDLRTALLPYVKSSVTVDPETGKLPKATAAYFEAVGDQVFERMISAGLITAGKTTVNADSNLMITPRVLEVSFVVVPTGCIDEIKGTINLKTNL
ncbi:MAG: hypothetical protein II956_14390 [Bacteroidales bacterium]|nr:hypothetical protein [Bacteroidales bacterium]